ncbi:MAG TPA: hypothetical protein PK970_04340 [Hyphomicrobiaceae bacterium]|nr:hypothetical protein [Hyphomicrobiaceae bacterium]
MPVNNALQATFGCAGGWPDKQATLTALHAAARMRGWRVGALHWNKYPMSFHWAGLEAEHGVVSLLVHADRPVAALTPGEPQYMALAFFDDPGLAEALAACRAPFGLLPAADLSAAMAPEDAVFVRGLGRDFAHNMGYWKPKTAGEVIFNWWD